MPLLPGSYLSFLLRLRRVDNGGRPLWRLSLESPGDAAPHHFATADDLLAYLQSEMSRAEQGAEEVTRGQD